MKRIAVALTAIVAALALVACGGGGGSSTSGGGSKIVLLHGRELTMGEASDERDRVCGEWQRVATAAMRESGVAKVEEEEFAAEKRESCDEIEAAMGVEPPDDSEGESGGSTDSPAQEHLDELAESYPELRESAFASAALLKLTEGDAAGAQAELAEACPDTAPAEAMEHLEAIQQAGAATGKELEAELAEDLC
jgi:hypothetical protein